MEKKIIQISLDNGYNGIKAVINKQLYVIPSDVVKVDFETVTSLSTGKEEDNLRYTAGTKTYFIGTAARRYLNSNKKDMKSKIENLVSEKRIVSEEYIIGLETALAFCLYKYSESNKDFSLKNLAEYEIQLAIALPHRVLKEYMPGVVANMAKKHSYVLNIGANEYKVEYTISDKNVLVYSQVIAAILGELLDDDGQACLPSDHPLNQLPTLVGDGGWYTFGLANVREGLTIYDNEAESNSDFAMNNICQLTCDNIKEKYGLEFVPREIEDRIINQDTKQRYKDKDGTFKTFDILEEREIASDIIVKELLDYMDSKYEDLVYTKNFLLTGGEGAAIYEKVKANKGPILGEDHILLTEGKFNGEKVDPMFAIAVGAYKALCGSMNN